MVVCKKIKVTDFSGLSLNQVEGYTEFQYNITSAKAQKLKAFYHNMLAAHPDSFPRPVVDGKGMVSMISQNHDKHYTIAQLLDMVETNKKNPSFGVFSHCTAFITKFKKIDRSWYESCPNAACNRKVICSNEQPMRYFCQECNKSTSHCNYVFNIIVML